MITCQCAEAMRTYATQSSYLTPIPNVNIDRGVIPLDSLPADWWNWLWHNITLNEGYIVQFINSVFSEINSVLSAAGVSPSTASTTDLRDAIQALAQVVATSSVPGSVLSSTLSGKLNVIADGTATINGLGTPSDLQTTADSVVAAINEVLALAQGKAPTSHASSNNTYGVGTTQQYGHVKLCDSASAVAAANGVAATPAAVKSVADSLASYQLANNAAVAGKAPISHASSATTYGVGTTQQYGHVKVTEGCGLSISGGTISLDAPGYNCLGNVTTICFNGNKYTPTNGVINLGTTPTINANCVCQRAISSSTAGDFYPILGGGLRRTTSGVGEVNLVGLRWNPVRYSLEWDNNCINIGNYAYSASLGGITIGTGACIECCSLRSVAIGVETHIYCCSTDSVAIGSLSCVQAGSVCSVAIGPGAFAGRIYCNGRNFYLQTIGDAYQLRMYVCGTTAPFQWCDLAKTLQTLFWLCYQGRYTSCPNYIYLSESRGSSFRSCITLCSAYPHTNTEEFMFAGALAKPICNCCSCWVDIYWGNDWRRLSCTTTGGASWLDVQGRTIMVTGLIGGI